MSSLTIILNNVLRGEHNFCCICFNTEQNVILNDQIFIDIDETQQNIAVSDILQSVLGNEAEEYLTIFAKICEDCLKTIISIYTFKQQYQKNAILLINMLDGLNRSIKFTEPDNEDINCKSQSLFVTLNIEDFTSKHIYDSEKLDSTKSAVKRFMRLNMSKKDFQTKCEVDIKLSDMLLNLDDQDVIQCKECFKVFSTLEKLKIHFLRRHAPNNYKCYKCMKLYGTHDLLVVHNNKNHRKVICSKCGITLKNRATLKKHEMGHHMKLVCPDCGRSYKNKSTYKHHIEMNVCKQETRASPANAQHTCDYCGKKYTQKMSLRVHIQYDHGNYKAHICEWCGKKFWAQSRLKAHIVKHTQEKNFNCSICQRMFVTKESLLYHTRLHTGEKPYKCPECEFTFISASRRSQHMKTYHFLLSEECEICHSKFASRMYLEKHMKCHKQDNAKQKNGKALTLNNEKKIGKKYMKGKNNKSFKNKYDLGEMEIQSLMNEQQAEIDKKKFMMAMI